MLGLHFDASTFRQKLHCFAKINPFALHHEAEDIASDIANPTLPTLTFSVDLHTGTSIVVPRAEGNKVPTLPAQLQISSDQIDDVDRLANLFFKIKGGRLQRLLQ